MERTWHDVFAEKKGTILKMAEGDLTTAILVKFRKNKNKSTYGVYIIHLTHGPVHRLFKTLQEADNFYDVSKLMLWELSNIKVKDTFPVKV